MLLVLPNRRGSKVAFETLLKMRVRFVGSAAFCALFFFFLGFLNRYALAALVSILRLLCI